MIAGSGVAPAPRVELGETRLCGTCATLIRYWPADSVWRHCIAGIDHAPELVESRPVPVAPPTESEQRMLWGDR